MSDDQKKVICITCGVERTPQNANGAHDWELDG